MVYGTYRLEFGVKIFVWYGRIVFEVMADDDRRNFFPGSGYELVLLVL
jgi:hypothetical protein